VSDTGVASQMSNAVQPDPRLIDAIERTLRDYGPFDVDSKPQRILVAYDVAMALAALNASSPEVEPRDFDVQACSDGLTFDVARLKKRVELDAAIVSAAERLREAWNRLATGVPLRDACADLRDAVDAKSAALEGTS
jgi:hypothetical protein